MEFANVQVSINENQLMNIYKTDVTPAEVVLLQMIHGQESVNNIQLSGNNKNPKFAKRTMAQEIERLKKVYGEKKFKLAYPGATPRLASTFADLGIDFSKQIAAEAKASIAAKKDKKVEAGKKGLENKTGNGDEEKNNGPENITIDDVNGGNEETNE